LRRFGPLFSVFSAFRFSVFFAAFRCFSVPLATFHHLSLLFATFRCLLMLFAAFRRFSRLSLLWAVVGHFFSFWPMLVLLLKNTPGSFRMDAILEKGQNSLVFAELCFGQKLQEVFALLS
jgi:uncharacterized membrane protein